MKLSVVPGLAVWHWGFNELSAAFFIMGVIVGLLAGMRLSGTAQAYVRGFRGMAYAGLLIGFARAIYVVLQDGRIIDTIVHAMFTPLEGLPVLASAFGMVAAHGDPRVGRRALRGVATARAAALPGTGRARAGGDRGGGGGRAVGGGAASGSSPPRPEE